MINYLNFNSIYKNGQIYLLGEEKKEMKKFLIVLILCTLILSGFRAFAIPNSRYIEKSPLNMQGFSLEIKIEGGLFGYSVTVTNDGAEEIKGNLSLNITTDSMFVILGETISKDIELDLNPINGIENFNLKPLIAFGSSTITISGSFKSGQMQYPINNITSGYAFVVFILCDETTIKIT
jgi:hypothetical protein